MNLVEGLMAELDRNKELLKEYEAIGPVGVFGATLVKAYIKAGTEALASGDTVAMLAAYQKLKNTK